MRPKKELRLEIEELEERIAPGITGVEQTMAPVIWDGGAAGNLDTPGADNVDPDRFDNGPGAGTTGSTGGTLGCVFNPNDQPAFPGPL